MQGIWVLDEEESFFQDFKSEKAEILLMEDSCSSWHIRIRHESLVKDRIFFISTGGALIKSCASLLLYTTSREVEKENQKELLEKSIAFLPKMTA